MNIILSGMLNAARGSGQVYFFNKGANWFQNINFISKGMLGLYMWLIWSLYGYNLHYSFLESLYIGFVIGTVGFIGGNSKGFIHSAISGVYTGKEKFKTVTWLTDKIYSKRQSRIYGAWWLTVRSTLYYPQFLLLYLITGPSIYGLGVFFMGLIAYLLGFPLKNNPKQLGAFEFIYGSWIGFLVFLTL